MVDYIYCRIPIPLLKNAAWGIDVSPGLAGDYYFNGIVNDQLVTVKIQPNDKLIIKKLTIKPFYDIGIFIKLWVLSIGFQDSPGSAWFFDTDNIVDTQVRFPSGVNVAKRLWANGNIIYDTRTVLTAGVNNIDFGIAVEHTLPFLAA